MRTLLLGTIIAACVGLAVLPAHQAEAKKKKKKKTFLYIHNNASSSEIRGFAVDKNGNLDEVPGSPFAVPGAGGGTSVNVGSLAYSPDRKLLFVTSDAGVSSYSVSATGVLALLDTTAAPATVPLALAQVKSGTHTYVYSVESYADQVRGFEAAVDGSLTEVPGSPFGTGGGTVPIGITVAKGRLYVALNNGNVAGYTPAADGSLTAIPGTPVAVPGAYVNLLSASPDGSSIYVGDGTQARIFGFSVAANGGLTAITNSPFAGDTIPLRGLAVGSKKVYTADPNLALTQPFARAANGRLTKLGNGTNVGATDGVILAPSGKLLVAWNGQDDTVVSYNVALTGALSLVDNDTIALTSGEASGAVFAEQ